MRHLANELIKKNRLISSLYGMVIFVIITAVIFLPSVFRAKTNAEFAKRTAKYGRYDHIIIGVDAYALDKIYREPLSLNISRYGRIQIVDDVLVDNSSYCQLGSFDDVAFFLSGITPIEGRLCNVNEHEAVLEKHLADSLGNVSIGDSIVIKKDGKESSYLITGIIPDYTFNWRDGLVSENNSHYISNMPSVITGDDLSREYVVITDIITELVRIREDDHSILYTSELVHPSGERGYEYIMDNGRNPRWQLSRMNDRYSLGIVLSATLVLVISTRYFLLIIENKLNPVLYIGAEQSQYRTIIYTVFMTFLLTASAGSLILMMILKSALGGLMDIRIMDLKNLVVYSIFVLLFIGLLFYLMSRGNKGNKNESFESIDLLLDHSKRSVYFKYVFRSIAKRWFTDLTLVLVIVLLCALAVSNSMVSDTLSRRASIIDAQISIDNSPSFQESILINDFEYGSPQGLTSDDIHYLEGIKDIENMTYYFCGFYETLLSEDNGSDYAKALYRNSREEKEGIPEKYSVDPSLLPKAHGEICVKTIDRKDMEFLEKLIKGKGYSGLLDEGVIVICKDIVDYDTGSVYKNDYYYAGDSLDIAAIDYVGDMLSSDGIEPDRIKLLRDSFNISSVINIENEEENVPYNYSVTVIMSKAMFFDSEFSDRCTVSFNLKHGIGTDSLHNLSELLKQYVSKNDELILRMPDYSEEDLDVIRLYHVVDMIFYCMIAITIGVSLYSVDIIQILEDLRKESVFLHSGIRQFILLLMFLAQKGLFVLLFVIAYRGFIRPILSRLEMLYKISSIVDLRLEIVVQPAIDRQFILICIGLLIYIASLFVIKVAVIHLPEKRLDEINPGQET
ncbi:MAG: hypothetical protein IKN92_05230 [Clostridia bacterium]|nr:hypothetical protein [Clostridia bacterium]